jgi:hypothetical protein
VNLFVAILWIYLIFFAYLQFAGVGMRRTLELLWRSGTYSSLAGVAVGLVGGLVSAKAAVSTFLFTTMLVSACTLPALVFMKAREFVLPRSSALEVVGLNVLVMVIGAPPRSYPFLDVFFRGGFHLLLNPFVLLMPAWLGFALSFWPSALAMRFAARGDRAGSSLRRFLPLWVQCMSIVWVLPAAIGAFRRFDSRSIMSHAEIFGASLGLVYVVMTLLDFRGTKVGRDGGVSSRMDAGPSSPFVLAVAGVSIYLLTWAALAIFLDLQSAASVGFVVVMILGMGLNRGASGERRNEGQKGFSSLSWLNAAVVLVVALSVLNPIAFGILAARSRDVYSYENAEPRYPDAVRQVDATSLPCKFGDARELKISCPKDISMFGAVRRPHSMGTPEAVFFEQATYFSLKFGERELNCAEMPARIRGLDGSTSEVILLLLYPPDTVSSTRFAWVADIEASCRRIALLTPPPSSELPPGFAYLWHEATAAAFHERLGWISDLKGSEPPSSQK